MEIEDLFFEDLIKEIDYCFLDGKLNDFNAGVNAGLDLCKGIIRKIFQTEKNLADIKSDSVSHPCYYNSGNIEVIDFIEDQKLNYHLGSALAYICRAGKKDPSKTVEDLQKAVWYINRFIGIIENEQVH